MALCELLLQQLVHCLAALASQARQQQQQPQVHTLMLPRICNHALASMMLITFLVVSVPPPELALPCHDVQLCVNGHLTPVHSSEIEWLCRMVHMLLNNLDWKIAACITEVLTQVFEAFGLDSRKQKYAYKHHMLR